MASPRRLLARLRSLRASGAAPLSELVHLVASELVSEVCSIYVQRPGDMLELAATEGLNRTPSATPGCGSARASSACALPPAR